MAKVAEVRVRVESGHMVKEVLWVSLQDDRDQSVSIGLFGDDFTLPGFTIVEEGVERYIDLEAQHWPGRHHPASRHPAPPLGG